MSRSPTDDALLPAAAARGCLLCLLVRNARAGQGAAGIGAPIQVASCMHAHRGTARIWHCGCGACAMLSAIALRLFTRSGIFGLEYILYGLGRP